MPINLGRNTFSIICVMLMVSMIFQNAAAEIETYTVDDDGSDIIVSKGQEFNISFEAANYGEWWLEGLDLLNWSYDSSVIEPVTWNISFFSENPGSHFFWNWTFKAIGVGTEVITFNHYRYWDYPDQPIDGNFTLNVTVVGQGSVNIALIIMVVVFIGVVPAIIIVYRMKGEEKHEK